MELNPYAPPAASLVGAPAAVVEREAIVPLFFPVSLTKLALLHFASLGLYQLLWFYQSWKLVRNRGEDVSPIARTVFSVLFCYSLFQRIGDEARSQDLKFAAGPLAAVWIVLTLASWSPDPGWAVGFLFFLSFLSFLPLLAVQTTVNRLNHLAAPGHDPNSRFGVGAIATMAIGFPVLLLFVIGLLMVPVQ